MICLISIKGIKWIIHTALPKENIPDNIDPKVFKTKNNRFVVKSTCPSCAATKSQSLLKNRRLQGYLARYKLRHFQQMIPSAWSIFYSKYIKHE